MAKTYGWYPVTINPPTATWNNTGNWSNPSFWADLASSTFPPTTGTVPGFGDTVYLGSANITPPPSSPFSPPPYNVDITLNSATSAIGSLGLGSVASAPPPPAQPVLGIIGTKLTVTGDIVDHYTASFSAPIGPQSFAGGGFITLSSAAELDVGGAVGSAIFINFVDASADVVRLAGVASATPSAVAGTFSGFRAGNLIGLANVAAGAKVSGYNATTGALTIKDSTLTTILANLVVDPGSSLTVSSFSLVADAGAGGVDLVTCFVEGTRVRTPAGETAIETLREGDLVLVRDPETAAEAPRPIKWIGRRRINLRRHRQPDQASPIRIRRNACAEGLPQRDLLVSPDHAIFLDGVLVPARLLVNASTITQELHLPAVQYFHIELDRHAILLAEGLPTESYLDTGNRSLFENGGAATTLHPDLSANPAALSWSEDSCAKLAVEPSLVEPIWRRLADRATALGFPEPAMATIHSEAAPWLEVDGHVLRGTIVEPGHVLFALPAHVRPRSVRLRSDSARPTDRTPWLDDRRRLGIPVERILLHGSDGITDFPMDHPDLATGWWQTEREAVRLWRWTDGNATVPVREDTRMIEICTMSGMHVPMSAIRAA